MNRPANPLADAHAPRYALEGRLLRVLAAWPDERVEELCEVFERWPVPDEVVEVVPFGNRTAVVR